MTPDHINAAFEAFGAYSTFINARRVYQDKGYAGIAPTTIIFFVSWGAWNLYFYPSVAAPWSFGAAIALFVANITWVSLMVYYGKVQTIDWAVSKIHDSLDVQQAEADEKFRKIYNNATTLTRT